jgi:hypothetical protein
MHVSFDSMPDSSRIWVYMSDRILSAQDLAHANDALIAFTDQWQVHGKPMRASFDIRYNHFIIIAADEQLNAASGCSIDDSVRILRTLGGELSVDFFNRNNVALMESGKLVLQPLSFVKKALQEKTLSGDALIVNTLAQTKGDLSQKWILPLSSSWLGRFLPQASVSL